ncbi:protocadherin-16-like isoform X1 [Paramormyrops kingsleyae]|uniref:Protocadherin-16 n=1 Tax=Paramormyrops kingsleyae TaxID=1676925 RepID=A0A3B3RHQ4_9TELE|nr:protocadherin-16-like isoform X1 [Paramormyrops kingsleyae]XP_023681835.1 protocadherin-16-like isoform X1 [Paramormyrops kingsleyae]
MLDPLRKEGSWTKKMLLLLYMALELMTAHSSVLLGTLELQLDEEQPAGTIVGDITAGLPPGVTASQYFISDHQGTGVGSDLHIDEKTGIIKTAKVLDHEVRDRYSFIAVTMTGVTMEVIITVNDINDHAPTFPRQRTTFKIPEQTAIGTRFPLDSATDADKDQLTTQGYLIKDGNEGQKFLLQTKRGSNKGLSLDLVVNGILDREQKSSYTLLLEAFDGGSPKKTGQMILDIIVQDINDNAPVFNQSRYHAVIMENMQPGNSILQVFANDADEGDNGLVLYEINRRQSDPDRYFSIDPHSGVITLSKPLDYEMRKVHELVVQARDNASQPEVTNTFVTIHVRDYNDNQPTMTIIFLSEDGSPQISEGAQPGQFVARISVSDPDYGEYSNVNVSLEGGDGKFALTTKDNIIYLICVDQILDREERDSYELRVMATDSGTPPLQAESSFTIQVTDVNDNPPLFEQQVYTQAIPEVVFPGSFVLQVTARDKDQGPNGDIHYSILQDYGTHSNWFTIDSATGIITTATQLDYETDPKPSLIVVASDGGQPPLSSTAVVNIILQDINDNEPVFGRSFYEVSINENTPAGTCFLEVTATDADSGSFGTVTYSIGSGIGSSAPVQFTVGKETGQICTVVALDRDQGPSSYDFTVTAVDGGGLNSMAYVKVSLVDINDNRPYFYPLQYAVSLSSQSVPGTSVIRVMAHDPDAGDNGKVTYHIVPGRGSAYFTLNKDTGVISLSRSLHGKANSIISMVIAAQDGGGLAVPESARVNISVVAGSVAPPMFERAQYRFTVPEDAPRGTEVGGVRAGGSVGASQGMTYSICSGDPEGYFVVDWETGVLRTNKPLDHEARPSLELEVQASSGSPPAFGQTRVLITVADVNDNAPSFQPSSSESLLLPEATPLGSVVYRVRAHDPDSGPNGKLTFDLAPSSALRTFSMGRQRGEIRLVGPLSYESVPRYDLLVTARDEGAPQLSAIFTLVVHVQAENHQGPVFDALTYRVELKEGTALNTHFLQVRALSREAAGPAAPLAYHLRPDGDAAGFGIAPDSGWLFVKSALDRETKDLYFLTVLATSGNGQLKKTGSATVRVSVMDENDNAPRLAHDMSFLAVRENLSPGTGFGRVLATDRDAGLNGRLTYRILHAERNFQINSQTGEISTRVTLDREQQSSHQLMVLVQDGGMPARSTTGTVHISVLDENDNAPSFSHAQPGIGLLMQVMEVQPPGSLLGTVQATDSDEGENGTIIYSLSGPRAERFTLNPTTGELRSASPLSQSDCAEYSFTVTASDRGLAPRSASTALLIQVLSSSRNTAKPNSLSMSLNFMEGLKPGSVVGSLRSSDQQNVPESGQVTYTVVSGTDRDGTFVVDRLTGDVYLARELDYERGSRYTLQVEVDNFSQAYPSSHMVHLDIEVQDSNDHTPRFPEDLVTIVIPENMEPGSSVYTFQAVDGDGSGPNSELRYSILQRWPDSTDLLTLDPLTGVLSLERGLDHEATSSLYLVVQAMDSALNTSQQRWGTVTARVFVTDVNDNEPAFTSPTAVSVMEDQPVGFVVLYVIARDPDNGENGRVSYHILTGNSGGKFTLNSNTGSLSILKPLDREEQDTYNLTIVAEDHGAPRHTATQVLSVQVIDVNDEAPLFEKNEYQAQILENQNPGTTVLTVSASDRDQGSNSRLTYGGIVEECFTIDPKTGVIAATRALDREVQEHYTVTVYAKDGGMPPNIAKATVTITVLDDNDNRPTFTASLYSLEVPENMEPVELFTLRATDQDTGASGEVEYRITAGDPAGDFHLDSASGVLSTSRPLDQEGKANYVLTVVAQDHGTPSLRGTATVEVSVLDINDNSPEFEQSSYTVDVPEDTPVGSFLVKVTAIDKDQGDNSKVLYFLSKESRGTFHIDQDTGRITTAVPLDRERLAAYSFHVFAVDSSPADPRNATAEVFVSILDINDNAPFFVQDPLIINISSFGIPSHRVVATMRAEDRDFGANGSVFYRFASLAQGFTINSLTGAIQVTESLQSLTQRQRTLIVEAMDQGNPAQSSLGVVIIYIKEQEYQGIRFSRNTRDVSIQENAAKGTAVVQIQAQHPDGSRRGISYSLFSGNRHKSFRISSTTGEILVQSSAGLDFEESPRLRLVVKAETASSSTFMAVNLILQDVNDNLPRFQLQNYIAYIREAQGYDFPIIQVVADDLDQGQNGQVTYSIRSSSMSSLFRINPLTGSITTVAIMDREIWSQAKLVVTATDRGTPRLAGTATLTIIVMDVNDNSPTIPLPREVRVPENTMIGTEITQVTGNDVDSGPPLSYTLQLDIHSQGRFGIHRYGGGVSLTGPLDFEERTWYTLTVRSSDSRHQSEANITVLVEDVNDNSPTFTQDLYQVTLPEYSAPGSSVITVTATDRDSGENGKVTYRVMSSTLDGFYIDASNGTLFINQKAEFDSEHPSITVVIEARDGGIPSLSSITTVQILVTDFNDHPPMFHQSKYRASVSEDSLPGVTILTLEAVDGDLSRENCGFDFTIASGNAGNTFQIESSVRFLEGRGFQTVGTFILAEQLDFESQPSYNLTVVASDRGVPQRSSSVEVIITVTDANDNPPAFSRTEYSVALSEGSPTGMEVLRLTATDPDSPVNAKIQYTISSGNEMELFSVDQWTGIMQLQRPLDRERQSAHVVIIQASDGNGHYALAPVNVEVKDINDNRPYFPLKMLTVSIRENQPPNVIVTMLHAIDYDAGVYGQLQYYMLEKSGVGRDAFTVNKTSGEVRTRLSFDYEKVNSFSFVAQATDPGNYSATVTVQVYVTGEDEYEPVFTTTDFSFKVPEGARKGQSIGQVHARDEDSGVDGIVLYSINGSPYFDINKTTGIIFLKMDGSSTHTVGGRSKREIRQMDLDVMAHSPLETSRVAIAQLTIDITHTSFGLVSDVNMLLISIVAASLGSIVVLVIIAIILVFLRSRRQRKKEDDHNRTVAPGTVLQKLDESRVTGAERIYHQTLPGYTTDQGGTGGVPYPRGGSLDPSHSSGRGSAEAEAAEDDEIRMINEYPRVSSISSSMQEHISARGPDSGIQQDADQLSDTSCEPGMETGQWFKGKKLGALSGTLLPGQHPIYRDEGGGYLSVGRGLSLSHPKDYAFPEDGKPSVDGSLTAIVASDEELRGSYNWDYLLNWCPQFQPLASVFTEIARLKDENAPPSHRRPFHPKAKTDPKPRIDPPPLITSVAHPGAKSVPPKPAIGRTFPHLLSLRRSPISHDGSISSTAMSPSFSPSLSPLAACSPTISPFGVSQGPPTSIISTAEHSLEQGEEAEMRI